MQPDRIVIGRAAEIALNYLPEPERAHVMTDIERLRDNPFPPGAVNAYGVEGPPDFLVLRTLDRLRVVYTIEPDGTIAVQDVINQGIVDRYFREAAPVA